MRYLRRWIMALLLLIPIAATVHAQSGAIAYGDTITATLTAEAPQGFYTFNGSVGDVVTAYVLGHNFQPTLALTGATGQLAFSNGDPFTPMTNDARVDFVLPQDGSYSLLIGSQTGTLGTFTLTLQQNAPAISTALTDTVTLNIPQGAPQQSYSISAGANPIPVTVQSLTDSFGFAVTLIDADGQVLAVINGGVNAASFTIPAGTDTYQLVISSADANTTGEVRISLTGGDAAQSAQATVAPATQVPDPNQCTLTTLSGVNLRQGPGTNYAVIGALVANSQLIATGQNSGWYTGTYNGVPAWVAASVVTATGACSTLPTVAAPPIGATAQPTVAPPVTTEEPTEEATPPVTTEEPTEEATPPVTTEEPTEEVTPPVTTEEPTEEATPPVTTEEAAGAPTAAPDSDLTVDYNFKSNSGQTTNGAISYPNGDTEDGVFYNITGFDSVTTSTTVRFTLFCNGDIEGVEIRLSNSVKGGCNTSFSQFFTNDSDTARIVIAYTSGSDSYVDWSLQAVTE